MAKTKKKSASRAASSAGKKSAAKPAKKTAPQAAAKKKTATKPAPKAAKPVKKEAVKPAKKAATKAPVKPTPPAPPVKTRRSRGGRRPAERETKPTQMPARPSANSPSLQLTIQPVVNQRPVAHKPVNPSPQDENKTRYSPEELREFEVLINEKLTKAREEFKLLKDTLNRNNDEGTDSTSGGNTKVLEDGAETAEKENLSQQAARQQKYIQNLENALIRIKNGTYGICSVTGKLISRDRLIAVPHTTQSIEAKMMQKD